MEGELYRTARANARNNNISTGQAFYPSNINNNKSIGTDTMDMNSNDNEMSHLNDLSNQITNTLDLKHISNVAGDTGPGQGVGKVTFECESGLLDSRGRRKDKSLSIKDPCTYATGETQGDYLNRLKASRKHPRSATASTSSSPLTAKTEDPRSLRRSTSQPKKESYMSPFRPPKQSTYVTRAATKKNNNDDSFEKPSLWGHGENDTERILNRRSVFSTKTSTESDPKSKK